jgi:hypothetical protein
MIQISHDEMREIGVALEIFTSTFWVGIKFAFTCQATEQWASLRNLIAGWHCPAWTDNTVSEVDQPRRIASTPWCQTQANMRELISKSIACWVQDMGWSYPWYCVLSQPLNLSLHIHLLLQKPDSTRASKMNKQLLMAALRKCTCEQ